VKEPSQGKTSPSGSGVGVGSGSGVGVGVGSGVGVGVGSDVVQPTMATLATSGSGSVPMLYNQQWLR